MQRRRTTSSRKARPGPEPALDDPSLAALVERARLLGALDSALRGAMEPGLSRCCRVANLNRSRLTLLASTSTVAARLRTMQDALLPLAESLAGFRPEKLVVKVAPLDPVPLRDARGKPLSGAAAAHLDSAASATADPELKDLLRRLASLA